MDVKKQEKQEKCVNKFFRIIKKNDVKLKQIIE